jgi:hypothetical protein
MTEQPGHVDPPDAEEGLVEHVEVEHVPDPDEPDPGILDPADTYAEGIDL